MAIKGNIVKCEYDVTGNAFAASIDVGDMKDDSKHSPKLLETNKTTRNEVLWAGQDNQYDINVFDTTKRTDLLSKWQAGTRIDVKLTWADGSTETISNILPKVGPIMEPMKEGELAYFTFTIYQYQTT